MNSRRSIAWILGLASLALFFTSVALMAGRLRDFNKTIHRTLWAFQEVDETRFRFAGKDVELTNADDPDGWKLVVNYGGEELRLRVTIPGDRRLPGLTPHRDWMRVLRFAEQTNIGQDVLARKLEAGDTRDRLVIVCRVPRPGADPQTWGKVWRKDTAFDFYEFRPEGGFEHTRLEYPHSKQDQPYAENELKEDTWQMQAALRTVPAGMGPKAKFRQQSMHALGWTWPAAFLGVAGLVISMIVGSKPRAERAAYRDSAAPPVR
jgi:hypothetical protein